MLRINRTNHNLFRRRGVIPKKIFLLIPFLIFGISCGKDIPLNPINNESDFSGKPSGTLVLNISVAPWNSVLAKSAAVQAMDSVKVFVYSSSGSPVAAQRLTLNGTRWQVSINVAAQNNMRVSLGYFGGSSVRYLGEKTGVNVTSGGSTTVDITVNYMGLAVTAPDSASEDFQVKWTSRPLVTGYQLQQDTKSDFSTAIQIYSGADTTLTVPISGKTSGQVYYYRARVNTAYGYGPWYSKGGDSTVGNISGTIIIDAPDLPDEAGGTEIIQGITLVSIPAGTFQMGQTGIAEPVHTVTLFAFEMSAYETTQGQYTAVIGSNPSHFTEDNNLPVEQVSWNDAIMFCNALSTKAGLQPCYNESSGACDFSKNGFRLPTEAEWEYACRAGSTTTYNLGDAESDLARAGWYRSNSSSKTHPVGGKTPNIWGLYDMHGNVWEWCYDWSGAYTSGSVTNPTGPSGSSRVYRGGCWGDGGDVNSICQSACRDGNIPSDWNSYVGFRVVRRPL